MGRSNSEPVKLLKQPSMGRKASSEDTGSTCASRSAWGWNELFSQAAPASLLERLVPACHDSWNAKAQSCASKENISEGSAPGREGLRGLVPRRRGAQWVLPRPHGHVCSSR